MVDLGPRADVHHMASTLPTPGLESFGFLAFLLLFDERNRRCGIVWLGILDGVRGCARRRGAPIGILFVAFIVLSESSCSSSLYKSSRLELTVCLTDENRRDDVVYWVETKE